MVPELQLYNTDTIRVCDYFAGTFTIPYNAEII